MSDAEGGFDKESTIFTLSLWRTLEYATLEEDDQESEIDLLLAEDHLRHDTINVSGHITNSYPQNQSYTVIPL